MLTAYNGLIIDYFHYLLIWQQQLCIGKVYVVVVVVFFFWGGGGGGGGVWAGAFWLYCRF